MLVLSQYVEQRYAAELLADGGGGVGYLLKDRVADVGGLRRRRAAASRPAARRWTPRSSPSWCAAAGGGAGALERSPRASARCSTLMAEGRSNAGIARALVVTHGAVEKHISNIFGKLDLPPTDDDHRRVLAVLAFLREGDA